VVGGAEVEPSGVLRKGLLAVLALNPGRLVPAERLIDALWGEHAPTTAGNSLQSHVSYLRRLLGERDCLQWRQSGYVLAVDADHVDATRAEALIGRAARLPDRGAAAALLREALALWHGPALADVRGLPTLAQQADRLDALQLSARTALVDLRFERGEAAELVDELEQLVLAAPLDEGLHARLITALYRSGRQADALAAFRSVRATLSRELGVRPGAQLRELEAAMLRQDPALDPPPRPRVAPPPAVASLPRHRPVPVPLSSFVGREREKDMLCGQIRTARLVTVLGPGGVGKTRLAIEAALAEARSFDVTAFADLSTLPPDPTAEHGAAAIVDTLLEALGGPPAADEDRAASLHAALSARTVLLLVDNCEHVHAPAAQVLGAALAAAPSCRVIATSREPLGLPGECCVPLAPLELPQRHSGDPSELLAAPAVQLLVQRARASDPWFTVTADTARGLAELCRRLDGIPLAVELAAARLRVMSPDELRASMDAGYPVLTGAGPTLPERHRSLDNAVRWSYSLLTASQQASFRAFGAFRGGGSLDAIARVCRPEEPFAASADVVALIDKSLLRRDPQQLPGAASPIRIDAHETIASVARDLLAASDDAELVRRRHAELVAEALRRRGAPGTPEADLRELAVEAANISAAIDWACGADADLGMQLASSAWWFWYRMGHADIGRRLLTRLLAAPAPSSPHRAAALAAAGYLAWLQDDFADATALAEQALAVPDAPTTARAMAHGVRSRGLGDLGDFAAARDEALRSAALYEADGNRWGAVWSKRCAVTATLFLGDAAAADDAALECLRTYEELGDLWGRAGTVDLLAAIAHHRDDAPRALRLADEAVRLHRELGEPSGLRQALQHFADAAAAAGDLQAARRLAEESLELSRVHGYRVGMLHAVALLAEIALRTGDSARAAGHAAEAVDLAGRLGDRAAEERARAILATAQS
jgi:predicted ATPase/DNA-binding SARP family transcriptional activator